MTWDDIKARFGQYITKEIADSETYSCEIQTFYPSHAVADRALGKISNEVASKLRSTNEGVSDLSGATCYHVVHEGSLTGREFKEYLITAVEAGGGVYEAFAR